MSHSWLIVTNHTPLSRLFSAPHRAQYSAPREATYCIEACSGENTKCIGLEHIPSPENPMCPLPTQRRSGSGTTSRSMHGRKYVSYFWPCPCLTWMLQGRRHSPRQGLVHLHVNNGFLAEQPGLRFYTGSSPGPELSYVAHSPIGIRKPSDSAPRELTQSCESSLSTSVASSVLTSQQRSRNMFAGLLKLRRR